MYKGVIYIKHLKVTIVVTNTTLRNPLPNKEYYNILWVILVILVILLEYNQMKQIWQIIVVLSLKYMVQ